VNDCQNVFGYKCRTSCESGEEPVSQSCSVGICCRPVVSNCLTPADCSKSECQGKIVYDNGIGTTCGAETKTCTELLGSECASDEECSGGSFMQATETTRCCVGGSCLKVQKTCSELGGALCQSSEQCSANNIASSDSTDGMHCCQGTCTKPTSVWFWVIIIILALALIAGGYYGYKKGAFKKLFKKKPSVPPSPFGFRPPVRPYAPPQFPFVRPQQRRQQPSEFDETMSKLKSLSEKK